MFSLKSFTEFCGKMLSRTRDFLAKAEELGESIKRPNPATDVQFQLPPPIKLSNKRKLDILLSDVETIKKQTHATSDKMSDIIFRLNSIGMEIRSIGMEIRSEIQTKDSEKLDALVEKLKQTTDALSSTVNK